MLISLPIDIDAVALRLAHGIDSDQLPAGLKALTVDDQIILDRSLCRWEERYAGGHELRHAMDRDDVFPWLDGDPRLAIVEVAANQFRDDLLMPAGDVLDALQEDWSAEEWETAFGLPIDILAARARAVLRLWAA